MAAVAMVSLVLLLSHPPAGAASPDAPEKPFALRVYYDSAGDIQKLQGHDVWEFNNAAEQYVLLTADTALMRELASAGWRVSIDRDATADLQRPWPGFTRDGSGYRTVESLYSELESLNSQYPELTAVYTYGSSYCLLNGGCALPDERVLDGYPLRALRITNESVAGSSQLDEGPIAMGSKPVFFLMAAIHAREITTPEIAMRLAELLLSNYGTDADLTWMVDHHEIWVVPVANPDGRAIVELGSMDQDDTHQYFQRKNADNDADGDGSADCPQWPPLSVWQFGIDLNRNHSFKWGPPGSSDQPCDQTFRGPSAASEPEVEQLEALIKALIPDQRGPELSDAAPPSTSGMFITLHSWGDLVLWPWGYTPTPAPNKTDLKAIGDKLAAFNGYVSCQPATFSCLYAANGTSDDWAYGELGVPAYTFEVGHEFMPPISDVDETQWPENRPALVYAARIARSPYMLVHGPDVEHATARRDAGRTIRLEAVASDLGSGDRTIAGAEAYIGAPHWSELAEPLAMSAADGAFDAPVEALVLELDASALEPGRSLATIRARDGEGHWGPVTGVFVDVKDPDETGAFVIYTSPWVSP